MSESTTKPEVGTSGVPATTDDEPQTASTLPVRFDSFQLMDRLDEEAIILELQNIASEELVYVVKSGGKEVTGLSKGGVDECVSMLARRGEVLREEDLKVEYLGEGEDRSALFCATTARYAVSADGKELFLDRKTGLKEQPFYRDSVQELTLDSEFRFGKKFKVDGKTKIIKDGITGEERPYTWRDVLEEDREYIEWIAEKAREEDLRDFCKAILDGEDIRIMPGRTKNPHWYAAGGMKAFRNAAFRFIPANVRAEVIARAKAEGKALEVDGTGRQLSDEKANGATDAQRNKLRELATSSVVKPKERDQLVKFIENPNTTKTAASGAIEYWMGQIKKRKESQDPDEAADQQRIDDEARQDAEGEATEPADGGNQASTNSASATSTAQDQTTSPTTTTDAEQQDMLDDGPSEAMTDIIREISNMLNVASAAAKTVWKGYFEAMVEAGNSTMDDYKKLRKALLADAGVKAWIEQHPTGA